MSSADTYMIVTSALVVRNVYAPYVDPDASEEKYVRVARLTGLLIIAGAAAIAMTMGDVFKQFVLAIQIPILFAAPFWVGMYWRRANTRAVWVTMAFSLAMFFVLPYLVPAVAPSLRDNPNYAITTHVETTTTTRVATASDVARYEAWEEAVARAKNKYAEDPGKLEMVLKSIGPPPPKGAVGDMIEVKSTSGGHSVFWSAGVEPGEGAGLEVVADTREGNVRWVVERRVGPHRGKGAEFQFDFLIYQWLGIDLSSASKATLQTLRLPPRLITPFLILIVVSFFTRRNSEEALDRYFVKMKTVVQPDPEADRRELEISYQNPKRFEDQRLLPGTDLEFVRPRFKDVTGFFAAVAVCFVIVMVLIGLVSIGS